LKTTRVRSAAVIRGTEVLTASTLTKAILGVVQRVDLAVLVQIVVREAPGPVKLELETPVQNPEARVRAVVPVARGIVVPVPGRDLAPAVGLEVGAAETPCHRSGVDPPAAVGNLRLPSHAP